MQSQDLSLGMCHALRRVKQSPRVPQPPQRVLSPVRCPSGLCCGQDTVAGVPGREADPGAIPPGWIREGTRNCRGDRRDTTLAGGGCGDPREPQPGVGRGRSPD